MSLPQRLRRPPQGTQWVLVRLAGREVEVRGGTKCHPSLDRRRCTPSPSIHPARQTRHTDFSHTSRSPSSSPHHPRKSLSPRHSVSAKILEPPTTTSPSVRSLLLLGRAPRPHFISHLSCCDGNDKTQVWKVRPLPDRRKLCFFPGPNASYTLSPLFQWLSPIVSGFCLLLGCPSLF